MKMGCQRVACKINIVAAGSASFFAATIHLLASSNQTVWLRPDTNIRMNKLLQPAKRFLKVFKKLLRRTQKGVLEYKASLITVKQEKEDGSWIYLALVLRSLKIYSR